MRLVRIALLVVVLGIAPACGGDSNPATGASSSVLAFTAPIVGDDTTFDGSTLAGSPVVFWFWAPT